MLSQPFENYGDGSYSNKAMIESEDPTGIPLQAEWNK